MADCPAKRMRCVVITAELMGSALALKELQHSVFISPVICVQLSSRFFSWLG